MYCKSLIAFELRDHIEELIQFVNVSQHGHRRIKTICCDKFSSFLDKAFEANIRAKFGIEIICSPPYMPDKHRPVENCHHRLQTIVRKSLLTLPGTKMMQGTIANSPSDYRRHTIGYNSCWWGAAHMYSFQILNHSPNISNNHNVTKVGSDVAYSSHQLFYHNSEHSIDLEILMFSVNAVLFTIFNATSKPILFAQTVFSSRLLLMPLGLFVTNVSATCVAILLFKSPLATLSILAKLILTTSIKLTRRFTTPLCQLSLLLGLCLWTVYQPM